jgi:hypothetical protein
MPALHVSLNTEQQAELLKLREHHPKPYVRERAAAILKVASGQPVYHVALYALLRPRQPETVSRWISRYLADGATALLVKGGRGRKPAFSPSASRRWASSKSSRE